MKKMIILGLLISFIFLPKTFANPTNDSSSFLLNCSSFKASIVIDGQEIEWEYQNPNEYELEKGTTVVKGQNAQDEVQNLYDKLNIHEQSKVEELVSIMKDLGYENLEKLDVRWINQNEELFTWVWEKN